MEGAPGGVRRTWWLWLLAALGPGLLLGYAIELWLVPQGVADVGSTSFEDLYPNLVFGSMVPVLGALILSRIPRHPVGWLFLACGLASALTMFVYTWAWTHRTEHPLPGTLAAAWVSDWIWTMGVMPLASLGLLLFPDGKVPGPRWRPLLWSGLAMVGLNFLGHGFVPGPLENHPFFDNPVGVPLPREWFVAVEIAAVALFGLGFFGGVASLVVRWRRATGADRAQLRWVALSAALLAAMGVVPPSAGMLGDVLAAIVIPLFPVSVAVAILRHRLYGIEVVLRRSLAYAALTAVLLLVYVVAVTALGRLLGGHADGAAALAATAFVAIGFAPLRSRLQHQVDRMLYGETGDPYLVLTGVGRRLDESVEDPLSEVAHTVASSLRLPFVRVEVDQADHPPIVASHGVAGPELHEVPLTFRGDPVGRMLVAPRSAQDPFRAPDLRLLEDLGRQVGVVGHAVGLAAALQRSRESLVTLREEERRRIRRDLHDGLGPSLAGIALGLDAVHRIAPDDPAQAAELARELAEEVQGALADVRRLVEDLRPPSLDQLGLVGAVRQHADRLTDRDPGLEVSVGESPLTGLPAAVEVAAYRIATEALTNVARHADARHARVDIGFDTGGRLVVEVTDDGCGLAPSPRAGIGLSAMRERAAELGGTCEAARGAEGGTRVRALLPVGGSR
jgi:signal transduction histidine kinase